MDFPVDLRRLQDFFDPDDVEWKPVAVSKKTGKGLAAPYVTNRAIMDRLDEVCGPANWKNEYREGPAGGVICGLSIRVATPDGGSEWVTKWDGAENTDVEAVKGGLSTSMRRTAVQWGIGRYLYRLEPQWVPVDQHGRFSQQPRIPSEYLPRRSAEPHREAVPSSASSPATPPPASSGPSESPRRSSSYRRSKSSGSANGRTSGARSDVDEYRLPG